jgi:ubiquinone/menaquinone biosynthesis C-methylase UbiE
VCPWWIGYLLASPMRRWRENPDELLAPLVEPGMTVVDIGCAMGFFSLPAARLVGPEGRVVCVDVQRRMLSSLAGRARRKGFSDVVETRLSTQADLGLGDLEGKADLALAIHVVHETAYPSRWFRQVSQILRPGGRLVVTEPSGHVTEADFDEEMTMAASNGFEIRECPGFSRGWSMTCVKPELAP